MAIKKDFIDYLIKKLDKTNLSKNTIKHYKDTINEIKTIEISILRSSIALYISKVDPELLELENNYSLDYNLESTLKNAMYLELNLFNKYINIYSNICDTYFKNIVLNILNSKLISFNIYNDIYNNIYIRSDSQKREVYCCDEFFVLDNQLNLIIHNIVEEGNVLYVHGYIFNLKPVPLSMILDFKLELKDSRGIAFASKVFKNLDIGGHLGIHQGKRIKLAFLESEYDLNSSDLSRITWNYTYNFC
jgi:hypothetical protein